MSSVASARVLPSSAVERVYRDLIAGAVCGFLAIVLSISFGSLLLPVELHAFLPAAIGMALFSTMVMAVVAALSSPIAGAVSVVQEVPVVAIAGMASAIAAGMAGRASPETTFLTIVAAAMLATIATGLILLVLGFFRLGSLVRFVPFPVIGGFLAGTGWLIFQGGLSVIAGAPVELETLSALVTPAMGIKAAAVLLFIGAVAVAQARWKGGLILPGASFVAIIIFNVVVVVTGMTTATLHTAGWLVPLPGGQNLWPPIHLSDIAEVDWPRVAGGLVAVPGIVSVTVMGLLMNATGIELDRRRDVDLNAELLSVGLQSLAAGAGVGLPGFPAVSLTFLAARFGAANRSVGLIVAGLTAAALFLGDFVLDVVPTPLLGGLLIWVGGGLMVEWIIRPIRRLAFREYLIVLLIFVVVVFVSFPFGILAGLVAAAALFVLEYSRVDTVRYVLRGSEYQSNIEGSEERRAALRRCGAAILILPLQGYLFFGTAERLRKKIVDELTAKEQTRVRFVLVDLHRVTGMDSSAALSFIRLLQVAAHDGFMLVATGGIEVVLGALRQRGVDPASEPALRFERDIEHGLAWCENKLLEEVAPELGETKTPSLQALIKHVLRDDREVERLAGYCSRIEVAPGDALISQGAPSDDIYFIERGRASVTVEGIGGARHLAYVGAGAVVGEVAFYLGRPRTASVVAEESLAAWRFTRADLRRLETEFPAIAFRLHEGLAAMLAGRLTSTNRLVRFFAD